MSKEVLSGVAIALTFVAFGPYVWSIVNGRTKPHVFSWVIWGSVTFIAFLAQLTDGGGAGAWPIGISGIITFFVAVLAYSKRGEIVITRVDWVFFAVAMASIPLWYITSDPLSAIVVLTTLDVIGFAPTARRAYAHPWDEQLRFFTLMGIRNLVSVAALEHYSLTTVLFPAVIAATTAVFVAIVLVRRRVIARPLASGN